MWDEVPKDEITSGSVGTETARSVEHTLIMRHAHDDPFGRTPDFFNSSQHAAPHGLLDMPSTRSYDLIMSCLIVDLSLAR